MRESTEILVVPPVVITQYTQGEAVQNREPASFATPIPTSPPIITRAHIAPPAARGVFVTVWTFSRKDMRTRLSRLADDTEINAWVVDIKGNDGIRLTEIMSNKRIRAIVDELHTNNMYLIGRITVFQDSKFAANHPELALRTPEGILWKDQGGYPWLDPASEEVWEYTLETARNAVDLGFDEIQLDYIRFPSEGTLAHIEYPWYDRVTPKAEVITSFMKYFHDTMKQYAPTVVLSADIFGYTLLRDDDNGIGQRLLDLLPYIDFISPMVYPSHYAPGNFGFKNPAEYPYEVITRSMEEGIKTLKLQLEIAYPQDVPFSSPNSSKITIPSKTYPCSRLGLGEGECTPNDLIKKTRLWLQDFSLKTEYDAEKVKAQITAAKDIGFTTWMLWNPNNIYTREALEMENESPR